MTSYLQLRRWEPVGVLFASAELENAARSLSEQSELLLSRGEATSWQGAAADAAAARRQELAAGLEDHSWYLRDLAAAVANAYPDVEQVRQRIRNTDAQARAEQFYITPGGFVIDVQQALTGGLFSDPLRGAEREQTRRLLIAQMNATMSLAANTDLALAQALGQMFSATAVSGANAGAGPESLPQCATSGPLATPPFTVNFDPTDPMNSRGYSDSRRSGFYGKRRAGQGATDWERVDPNAKDPDARAPKPDVTFAQGDFDYSLKDHTSTRNINGVDVTSSATVGTRGGGSLSVGDGQLSARGQLQAGVEASTAASYSSGPVSLDADARVRAGFMASGEATIGKDGFHTQGEAFFGVKADANLSADIGGVRGTAGVEAWAGAGVEADVDFGFQDGKFTVGGKLGAGLGLGGAVSGGVTIDVAEVGDTLNDVGDAVGEAADDAREAAGKVWDAVTPW